MNEDSLTTCMSELSDIISSNLKLLRMLFNNTTFRIILKVIKSNHFLLILNILNTCNLKFQIKVLMLGCIFVKCKIF